MRFSARAIATATAAVSTLLCHLTGAQAQTSGTADCLMENCSPSQSGYLDGYNFDPAVVGSSSFGQLWTVNPGRTGQVFLAQPITYTPPGGTQSVIVASDDNNVYVLDAITGATRASIKTQAPFLATDTKCTDLVPNIGITGTPYLDANLQTLYFWSKGYADGTGTTTGLDQGRYKFYGVDPVTLKTKFVTDPQGIIPNNRPDQRFEGGKVLQRTGLTELNGVIWAGFGGHCDNFNYTGWMIGMDAKTGAVVDSWVPQAGPFGTVGSGIWMAGAGISNDGNHLWVVTGNGYGEELSTAPRIGRSPPGALPMSVIKLGLNSNGTIAAQDFFTPSDFRAIDAADQDFGSSGVCFLPSGFSTSSVKRIAIANGKNSKAYIMNADNLGGYKTGAGGGDGNLQTIPLNGPSFSTVGGYPLEGGYIYISSTSSPTIAFKLSTDANGNPNFVQVGQTADSSTGTRGIGHTTTTSFSGQPGSGLLWVTDLTNGNLRVYPAIPPADGNMKAIFLGAVPNGNVKYQRPVPGNGRMFVVGTFGSVTAYGSPVNQPLNCTTPLSYGNIVVGTNVTLAVTCKAVIGTTIANVTQSDSTIKVTGFPAVGTAYTATSPAFTFNVTYSPIKFGPFTGSVLIALQNAKAGYVTSLPIVVRGTAVASSPTFTLAPSNVAFGGLVPGSTETAGGVNKSIQLSNVGLGTLTITSWDFDEFWSLGNDNADDDDDVPIGADKDGQFDKKKTTGNFTLYGMPTTIASQSGTALTLNFNPSKNGEYKANLTIYTSGGNFSTLLTGNADGPPKMIYAVQQYDGTVLANTPYMDFGNVIAGNSSQLLLTVTNTGESALTITKSKPPNDQFIHAVNPASDLTEGQVIASNETAPGPVILASQAGQVNTAAVNVSSQWVLNGNDPSFGVTFVQISGRIVSRQVGPRLAKSDPWDKDGTARFGYLGCYTDSPQSRALSTQQSYGSTPAENGACQSISLASGISNFVGTEYANECYAGLQPPPASAKVDDLFCEMPCAGDNTQICGDSGKISIFYDKLAYNATSGQMLPGAFLGPKNKPNVTASNGAVYNYIGCGMDPGGTNRPLKDYSFADGTSMTVEACVNACSSRGLTVAGLEYAQECYCGASLPAGTATNLQDCTMICKGDRGEYCGAGSRLTLYSRNGTAPPPTTTTTASATATATNPGTTPTSSGIVPSVGAWKYGGCWTDQLPNGRALAALVSAGSSVTAESCVASCQAAGYTIAGTENGNECWCGNGLALGSAKAPDADCSTLCAGNAAEVCGGPFRLTTYSTKTVATASQPAKVGNWTFQGCFNDTNTARALQGYANGQTSTNTLESCASICSAFTYFGTEYGSECYCGNTLANGAIAGDASLCNMPCPGDGTELCGAGNQLSVYKNPNPSPPSSTSTAGPTPTQTGTPTASLNIVPSANSLAYQGCWQEPAGGAQRALSTKVAEASNMTVQICTSQCKQAGFKIAGLEYAQECWCGNGIAPGSSKVADAQCSSPCAGNTTTACGGAFLLTSYSATAIIPASQPAKTGNWTFQGCYTDTVTARTLADAAPALGNNNSIQNCAAACSGYTYFGTEYGAECYCGNSILNGGKAVNATQCNLLCSGDGTQICGAGGLLSLYKNSQPGTPTATTTATSTATPTATSSPVIVPTVSGLPYQGCWQEPAGGVPRALATKVAEAANMTVQSCVGSCKSAGYSISGVEYSQECWCGNGISPGSTKIADAQCSNTCAGNSTQFCGGAFLLTTYSAKTIVPAIQPAKTGNWTFQGCYTDTVTARTLADASPALGNNNSIQNCAAACTGYTYFGTEYGAECYCGNSILNGGKAVNATQCNLLCSGDGTQICGAGGLLSLYKNSQPGTPTSTATATSTATPSATKTPVIVPTVSGLPYQGCWQEPAGGVPRALATKVAEATNMTVQSCVGSCKSAGYSISGVEYSQECWCGNGISPGSTKVADAQCSNTCAGNSTQFCGGAFLLTTYSTKVIVPATQPATVGTYSFKGCYNDTVTARTLGDLTVVGANTTLESCAAACSGYSYFGTEYGAECYCGNKILNGAVATDASKCNMLCGGNGSEICGAGGLLSLYTKLSATSSTTSKVTSSTTTSKATTSTTTSKVTTTSTTAASTTSKATTTTATSATTSKTTSTSSTSSTPTLTVTGLSALGCFVDNSTALSLNVTAYTNTSNSVSNCALYCRNRGFRFSGTEAGTKCFCGNYLQYQAASLGAGQSGCTTACPGDAKQTCGGTNRINIVQDTTWKQKLFTVSRAGKWAFQDCYINNSGARVLNVTLTPTSPITVPNCLDACLAKKLAYCGMGNGQTCYGGAVLASGATKSPSKGSTDPLARGCDMPCTGNSTQACGGSLRLELYRYNSTAASVSPPTLQIASAK